MYFDNFAVSVKQGHIIEENHYYSYGLKISAISSKKYSDSYDGDVKNNYGMQGAYSEMDDDIGWNDFMLRNYDPQIGRWMQQDPYQQFASPYVGMGNDPVNLIDPSGGIACPGTSPLSIFLENAVHAVGNALQSVSKIISIAGKISAVTQTGFTAAKAIHGSSMINGQLATRPVGIKVDYDYIGKEAFNNTDKKSSLFIKKKFPTPEEIMKKYPKSGEYCSRSDNECAIRMSIALSENDVDISSSKSFRETHKEGEVVHQPSAAALADWLSTPKQLGAPKIYKHPTGEWNLDDFKDKEGIIYFVHPHRGGTGPGHIDVVSGGKIGSGFYPNKIIWFWEFKKGSYIVNK